MFTVISGAFVKKHVRTKFCLDWYIVVSVSYMIYVPIVMYGLRLFIVLLFYKNYRNFNMTLQWLSWSFISVKFHF